MADEDLLLGLFEKNALKWKGRLIAVYGIGPLTKLLLEKVRGFQIIGLLDGFRDNGEFCGRKILTLDQAVERGVDLIVIVARPNSTKIIYRRIAEFCETHSLPVYDMRGELLTQYKAPIENDFNQLFEGEAQLREAICRHDVVSFDLFDTLAMRKALYPEDVFVLVERLSGIEGFAKKRMEAQRQLALTHPPSLREIYNFLSHEGLALPGEGLMPDLEMAAEMKLIIPRNKMIELVSFAMEKKKQVFCVSDMYLSKNFLWALLRQFGIENRIEIIVSSEYRTDKRHSLFGFLKKYARGKSCLHIGDDEADKEALREDIDVFTVAKSAELAEIFGGEKFFGDSNSYDDRTRAALFSAKAFNNPFILSDTGGKLFVRDAAEFGYLFVGPLLAQFTYWIASMSKGGCDYLLFLARDGYLIKTLYDKLLKELELESEFPKSVYFEFSRSVGLAAALFREEDILYAANLPFHGTAEEMLSKRFLLDANDILPFHKDSGQTEYIMMHKNHIMKRAEDVRKNFKIYFERRGIKNGSRIGLFDFVSSGTCQMCLQKLIPNQIIGYYFSHVREPHPYKEALHINHYDGSGLGAAFKNYLFLENIIKAEKPTVVNYDVDGNPVYGTEKRSLRHIETIREMQGGIKEYFKDDLWIRGFDENRKWSGHAELFLNILETGKYQLADGILKEFIMTDELTNRTIPFDLQTV